MRGACLAKGTADKKGSGERDVLTYDLGGGTFDVSPLMIEDGIVGRRVKDMGLTKFGHKELGDCTFDVSP